MAYTTDWKVASPLIGAQPITEISTTAQHPLGTIVKAVDRGNNANGEGEFMYVKGITSTVVGSWWLINEDDYSTSLLAGNDIGRVGIAMAILDANTKYGWAQIRGKAVAKVAASFADNGLAYTSSAGVVDDTAVAGDRVKNCKGASAIDTPATGLAEFEIANPYVDDATAA